jgi:hypothetical protein
LWVPQYGEEIKQNNIQQMSLQHLSEKQTNILLSAMKKVILPNLELPISTGQNAMLRYV